MADQLLRAGVGFLRICDRDLVEETNLQRQVLFDEDDARQEMPKALAAQRRLAAINSSATIDARVVGVHAGNVEALVGDRIDLILDGTDNVQTRYLVNDVAVKHGIPWVYGACVAMHGRVMGIVPGKTACLRCVFSQPPGAGELQTCDTAGVLGAAASIVASMQVVCAMKILLQAELPDVAQLITLDVWNGRFYAVDVSGARREECPCCGRREFEFLNRPDSSLGMTLCGRNAVQVRPVQETAMDLEKLAGRFADGDVKRTEWFVRLDLKDGLSMTVFADGRALIHGTNDVGRARSLYARYIGA